MLLIGVKRIDGELLFNPDPQYVFAEDDTLILMGRVADIREFKEGHQAVVAC